MKVKRPFFICFVLLILQLRNIVALQMKIETNSTYQFRCTVETKKEKTKKKVKSGARLVINLFIILKCK